MECSLKQYFHWVAGLLEACRLYQSKFQKVRGLVCSQQCIQHLESEPDAYRPSLLSREHGKVCLPGLPELLCGKALL